MKQVEKIKRDERYSEYAKLDQVRGMLGISSSNWAARAGITQQAVSLYNLGQSVPESAALAALRTALPVADDVKTGPKLEALVSVEWHVISGMHVRWRRSAGPPLQPGPATCAICWTPTSVRVSAGGE